MHVLFYPTLSEEKLQQPSETLQHTFSFLCVLLASWALYVRGSQQEQQGVTCVRCSFLVLIMTKFDRVSPSLTNGEAETTPC